MNHVSFSLNSFLRYHSQAYNSVAFGYIHGIAQPSPESNFRAFLSPPERNPTPGAVRPKFPSLPPLETANLFSASMALLVLCISTEPHNVVVLGLAAFTRRDVFQAPPRGSVARCHIIRSHAKSYSVVRTGHGLLIRITGGHLGGVHLSAVETRAGGNTVHAIG